MEVEWVDIHASCYQLKVNGTVEGILDTRLRDFQYYPNFGYDGHHAPFPDENLTIDEAKAWALTIYRMA